MVQEQASSLCTVGCYVIAVLGRPLKLQIMAGKLNDIPYLLSKPSSTLNTPPVESVIPPSLKDSNINTKQCGPIPNPRSAHYHTVMWQ